MSEPIPEAPAMSRAEFRRWVAERPDGGRWERVAGEPVAMAPERIAHARLKAGIWRLLDDEIRRRGLACEALPDGVVDCGPRLPGNSLAVANPVIVVEVLSPSAHGRDTGAKLEDYFRLGSVRHYLLIKTERKAVIHHHRRDDGTILTTIARAGLLQLDPPGIELDLDALYERAG